jgi:hypothetical protein
MTGTSAAPARRALAGLTLVEILATVFIMGLGLIMVAAAFPVGLDQMRLSVEDTQSAMAARSAMEIIRSQNLFQNMLNLGRTDTKWKTRVAAIGSMSSAERQRENLGLWISSAPTQPLHLNHSDFAFRVWNPMRSAYGGGGPGDLATDQILGEDETRNNPYSSGTNEDGKAWTFASKMWPPVSGDLVWRAFLTRLNFGTEDLPLFRVTIVVCRYTDAGPEMYTRADNAASVKGSTWADEVSSHALGTPTKAPPSARAFTGSVSAGGNRFNTNPTSQTRWAAEGHYLLNPMTGFCHRITTVDSSASPAWFELSDNVTGGIPSGTSCPVFSNVVGVYYGLLSG